MEKGDYTALKKELNKLKKMLENKTQVIDEFSELYDNPIYRRLAIDKFVEFQSEGNCSLIESLKDEEEAKRRKAEILRLAERNIDDNTIKVIKKTFDKLL